MDIISTIFNAVGALVVGIILGLFIAALIGVIALLIIKIRDRNKEK